MAGDTPLVPLFLGGSRLGKLLEMTGRTPGARETVDYLPCEKLGEQDG